MRAWHCPARRFARAPREQWDAETIVSTYTNTENHPSVLPMPRRNAAKPIALSRRTGIPLGVLGQPRRPAAAAAAAGTAAPTAASAAAAPAASAAAASDTADTGGGVNTGAARPAKESKEEKVRVRAGHRSNVRGTAVPGPIKGRRREGQESRTAEKGRRQRDRPLT